MTNKTMCEPFEEQISAWLDDELDRPRQVEMLDHLVRCAACRAFYTDARALDGMIGVVRESVAGGEAPPELWQRIERASSGRRRVTVARLLPAWGWRAAAAVVAAIGLGVLSYSMWPREAVEPPQDSIVTVGAYDMTDERFIEITREVLGADPRYHTAMFDVLDQVIQDMSVDEASDEPVLRTLDTEESVEGENPSPV